MENKTTETKEQIRSKLYVFHSFLEVRKLKLVYNNNSTLEDFKASPTNIEIIKEINDVIKEQENITLTEEQYDNAINWFLEIN